VLVTAPRASPASARPESPAAPAGDDAELAAWVADARERTFALALDLSDAQWEGPRLDIVNPLRWELGHVAWFQERWVLRHAGGRPPIHANADALYDSSTVPHRVRWDLPVLSRKETLRWLGDVRDRVLERIGAGGLTDADRYFVRLSVFHEDMHDESFLHTRQTLGYAAPAFARGAAPSPAAGPKAPSPVEGSPPAHPDVRIPGGTFLVGARGDEPFVFDNEKWAHETTVAPFSIARCAVTQGEFATFVDAGGYRRRDLWTDEGWAWRERARAEAPVYWRRAGGGFERRVFDRWVALEPRLAMVHVNAHEADAYCRFAGRRLPTETEWEVAAAAEADGRGGLAPRARPRPWGDAAVAAAHAALDAQGASPADVDAFPAGDSAFGCRQLWGNVWEWTSTVFAPYPGFVADPYEDYSQPWFSTHRVLRGGCFATRARLLRSTWRNFYTPDRRDPFAGFRTCALP
jgi:iron(II)-dependent oxidoreductase